MENASFVSVIMVVFEFFFPSRPFQPQERIMQYSLSFQFVLFAITLRGEVILNGMESCVCVIHLR